MNEHELLWAMLPDGLEEFFEVEKYEKNENNFRIVLKEKNIIPSKLPSKYQGKKVINTVTKSITIDYFPLKGRKTDIVLKRKFWKFAGVDEMLKRDLSICEEGTKLEKEFADFLKEFNRE